MDQPLFNPTEAKALLRCTTPKLFELIQEGKLQAFNISASAQTDSRPCYRICRDSVLELQRTCRNRLNPKIGSSPPSKGVDS
jgi:hypothetical protein